MPGPDIWGPHGWKFIHYITLGYPLRPTEQDKNKYFNFFMSLSDVIPCHICADHFKEHLEITPLDDEALSSKDELMKWAINMHNHVNARNGKKIYSVREAIKAIIENDDKCIILQDNKPKENIKNKTQEKFNSNNNSKDTKDNLSTIILSISIIINILLICYLLFKK